MTNKLKGHRGVSNNEGIVISPLALLWLLRMGLEETMWFVHWNS